MGDARSSLSRGWPLYLGELEARPLSKLAATGLPQWCGLIKTAADDTHSNLVMDLTAR